MKILKLFRAFVSLPPFTRSYMARIYLMEFFPRLINYFETKRQLYWESLPQATDDTVHHELFVAAAANSVAGIGHTLSEYNTGCVVAELLDVEFVHIPLQEPWETFLNFGVRRKNISEVLALAPRILHLPLMSKRTDEWDLTAFKNKCITLCKDKPVLIILGDGQNSYRQAFTSVSLRNRYWSASNVSSRLDLRRPDKINVAVHVRRRNAADLKNPSVQDVNSPAYQSRYISSNYFLDLCRIVKMSFSPDILHFNVFSQGNDEEFKEFKDLGNVDIHLKTNPMETFHNLALADILITSPSSFSFKAGMLCKGVKLARVPWWHEIPQDDEWIPVEDPPCEHQPSLIRQLQTKVKLR